MTEAELLLQAQAMSLDSARNALLALDISATQVGFGFGWRDALSDNGVWSPQLMRMLWLPADAPTPTREQFLAMVDVEDRQRVRHHLHTLPVAGSVREFEFGVQGPGGARRVLMTRAVMRNDEQGRPWRYYFVVIDMTETRAKDRRVAALLEHLQLSTEASGVGTWDRDPRAERSSWDTTTLALFGLPPHAPAPTNAEYLQIVHPDDRERVARELSGDGPSVEFEFRVCLPDGRVRWLVTRGRAQRDAQGRVVRRTGICLDITERREAQAALQARELAERANAAKTEFLSRMSHELRTPLNAVLGFAQVMALDPNDPLSETQRTRIGHIQAAGWHLLALINDVLDLARIEAGQAALSLGPVPVAEVVDECLAMNSAAAAERQVTQQHLPAAGDAASLWADRTRVRQVLLNLLSNAAKYNRAGGSLVVHAAALGAGEVAIEVRDDGPGLDDAQMQHLFEPFNRLGREHGPVEGTGIGLALSRLLAQQMGGRLEVQSQPGVGSVFRLVLPVDPTDAAPVSA
jgi:PAS domain S-box-containing protein